MAKPSRAELEAQLAAMQEQMAALQAQLVPQTAAGDRGVAAHTVTDS